MSIIYFLEDEKFDGNFSRLINSGELKTIAVSTERILKLTGVKKNLGGAMFLNLAGDGEECKSLETLGGIIDYLILSGCSRKNTLCAIGGGTLCDIASFAASVYKRGMELVMVPTTLLSMIDAAIGGKTAMNREGFKNIAGTFYPAARIIIAPKFLATLPEIEIENGLYEAFKYGLLFSERFASEIIKNHALLETYNGESRRMFSNIIKKCASYKIDVTGSDPYDLGVRKLLNLGHTVGHAIESFSGNRVGHGAAVGAGLLIEAVAARELGILQKPDKLIRLILKFLNNMRSFIPLKKLLSTPGVFGRISSYIAHDKKAGGENIDIPMLTSVAKPVIVKMGIEKDLMPVILKMPEHLSKLL